MCSSDITSGFQFRVGLMQLSCVYTAGVDRGVVQDKRNCLGQLQRSEILAFTMLLLAQ